MDNDVATKGLVVRTTGSWYRVLAADGGECDCRLRGNFRLHGNKQTNPIAVGDVVEYQSAGDGTGVIVAVEERRNCIIRRSTKLSKQTHVIAANIDQLCLVATLGFPRTSTGFIDRLLATAEAYHIPAFIVFNKCDMYDDELWAVYNETEEIYRAAGYAVYPVSALEGDGIVALRALVTGKTTLFCGHSGVGKSALLNAVDPSLSLRVGEVSQWSMKGKHTTTFAEIVPFHIDSDGKRSFLIDTPGIKEFGLVGITKEELSHFFPEMKTLLHDCRFANCTHTHEPGCAVVKAVDEGRLSPIRYQNYVNILTSMENGS